MGKLTIWTGPFSMAMLVITAGYHINLLGPERFSYQAGQQEAPPRGSQTDRLKAVLKLVISHFAW